LIRLIAPAAAFLIAACTTAPSTPAPEISQETLQRLTQQLSSDEFQGRAPGTEGETMTVELLAREFERAGLQPGNDGSWYQDVPLVEITAQGSPQLRISGAQSLTFNYRTDFVAGTYRAQPRVSFDNSEIVFVGYGINAPERGWNDYEGLDVRGKTVNPQWNIPPRIRKEHIAERGDRRTFIPGGAPDNPLGKHRIELADSLYAIHGTNIPWGIGMLVSHGCLRLYPEDIERLFPDVKVGTKVRFVYQTVKAGQRGDEAYVEAHADVYRLGRSLASDAQAALRRRGLAGAGNGAALEAALSAPSGVPIALGSSG